MATLVGASRILGALPGPTECACADATMVLELDKPRGPMGILEKKLETIGIIEDIGVLGCIYRGSIGWGLG